MYPLNTALESNNTNLMKLLEREDLVKIVNHPVHIIDNSGELSPSSFIPFCGFGRQLKAMGVKINNISTSVCNHFESVIRNDQICYRLDPNKFFKANDKEVDFQVGMFLMIDDNEDRQYSFQNHEHKQLMVHDDGDNFARFLTKDKEGSIVHLDNLDSLELTPGWHYSVNAITEMKATEPYMKLEKHIRKCNNEYLGKTTVFLTLFI